MGKSESAMTTEDTLREALDLLEAGAMFIHRLSCECARQVRVDAIGTCSCDLSDRVARARGLITSRNVLAAAPPVAQDDALFSDTAIGGVRQTWRQVAERERTRNQGLQAFRSLLSDLSRCEHGRHLGDACSTCGGPSVGNAILTPGTVIGHDISSRPIVVPSKAQFASADEWRAPHSPTPDERKRTMTELETTLIEVLENVKDYLDAAVRPTCGGAECECIIHDVDHAFAEIERLAAPSLPDTN